MSAATLAFGEPPIASPELALVDAALAAELRRSLPDPATPPAPPSRVEHSALMVVADVAPPELEPDARLVGDVEQEPWDDLIASEHDEEPVDVPDLAEAAVESPVAEASYSVRDVIDAHEPTEPSPEVIDTPAGAEDGPSMTLSDQETASVDDRDDLLVGYHDEEPVDVADLAEAALESPEAEGSIVLDIDVAETTHVPYEVLDTPAGAEDGSSMALSDLDAHLADQETASVGDCDDLLVGYHDEEPVDVPDLAEAALESPVTQAGSVLDVIDAHEPTEPSPEVIDTPTRAAEDEEAPVGDCDDLIVGFAGEPTQTAGSPVSAYPALPVPDGGVDTTEETDIALRNIQDRLTARQHPATRPKRRFRRRFTLMSGVVGASSLVVLTVQMYPGLVP